MRSARRIVDSRCAMTTTVRPALSSSMARVTAASFTPSSALVASSSSSTGASLRKARAMATRWRSPPDRAEPPSPTRVSQPRGRRSTTSASPARPAASRISCALAPGRPMRTFSSIVVSNR